MFKLFGTISNALIDVTTSVVGVTKSIDNLVESANHSTAALRLNAEQLEADVQFDCDKKKAARAAAMAAYEKELMAMSQEED